MKRNVKLDNLKAFLIFIVVLGHVFEFMYGPSELYGFIRSIIYSFHMPAFIFLSGYFSKNSKTHLSKITVSYLSTYLIFNIVFSLTPWSIAPTLDLLRPQIISWYLLCLLFWRVSVTALSKIKFIVPLSILFTLYIGCIEPADRFLSISRAICFLPFFLAGYFCSMKKINNINLGLSWLLLAACLFLTGAANYFKLLPVKMYEYIQCYHSTDVGNLNGIQMRLFMIIISFVIIICLIRLSPTRRYWFTVFGENSLMIYLIHIFPIEILNSYGILNFDNDCLNIAISVILSIALCLVLSRPIITTAYNYFNRFLVRIFTVS
ncbi:MAG: acyltransferase family protein [Eubacterium sp.]|nr:acyltransferase family protein [Eubacterium sp.]